MSGIVGSPAGRLSGFNPRTVEGLKSSRDSPPLQIVVKQPSRLGRCPSRGSCQRDDSCREDKKAIWVFHLVLSWVWRIFQLVVVMVPAHEGYAVNSLGGDHLHPDIVYVEAAEGIHGIVTDEVEFDPENLACGFRGKGDGNLFVARVDDAHVDGRLSAQ